MIPSEGAHDSNEQNVNDASKLGGKYQKRLTGKPQWQAKYFFSSFRPSLSPSLLQAELMLLSQGIILSKPLSSLSPPNKTAEYQVKFSVFQTHCFECVGVQ